MKPTLRKVTPSPEYSFTVRKDVSDEMINNWHYHPEFEILYIRKSAGTWLIGDHVGHFQSGNVVLLGSNLPHCYKHEPEFLSRGESAGETVGILFLDRIFGRELLNLPETAAIRSLLEKSTKGLQMTGETQKKCGQLISQMVDMSPAQRLVSLFALLNLMAEGKEYQTLSSGAFTSLIDSDQDKIKVILEYTMEHFHEKISLDEVAALVHNTRYSFCRFFKRKTKKTYVQFLMEVRIGTARRLLVEEEKNVTEICYACGFNNISHFHLHFKKITGMKPLEYRRNYLSANNLPRR
jgi:AraC-like DNA-binding protein